MSSDPGLELAIKYVPTQVNEWTVTRLIAAVLHSEDFAPIDDGRLINFQVKLNEGTAGGIRNDGTGTLTLPTEAIGHKFLKYVKSDPIKIEGKKLKFYPFGKPTKYLAMTLRKTPYIDPDIEEERAQKLRALEGEIRVDLVQFGTFYREKYPSRARAFSVEWEREYIKSFATLSFHYDHKLLLLKLGSELTDIVGYKVVIEFASIQRIAVGIDGRPYICFETLTPPVLEEENFHRTSTGDHTIDNKKYKQRVGYLDEGHRIVAPYAPHLRIELYNETDVIGKFKRMCDEFGIAPSLIVHFPPHLPLVATKQGFFTGKRLHALRKILKTFPWPVAFQLESLLHNCILHTGDIELLIPEVRQVLKAQNTGYAADLLRQYNEKLQDPRRPPGETPLDCFARTRKQFIYSHSPGTFRCCHVTFTPTRVILEGPYATQSNRVIRRYQMYEDHFLRVDFRDEDRLQYRWSREVDGTLFLHYRVGGTLKEGFELAGRQFEFLAYSNSALREHSVWFVNPFEHPQEGLVSGHTIRDSLGDFQGTELLKMPSKYAARLAQAFTATDAAVDIHRSEWEEIQDMECENKKYLFTDGIGTIARSLAVRIWKKLCEILGHGDPTWTPSAFQIRFLGYKGVVVVDEELDKLDTGILMRLRPSMRKFDVKNDEVAPIEIAQAFAHPITAYLNRPLVTVLEDVGVRKEAFMDLQNSAVAKARTIDDSLDRFQEVLASHNMGSAFRLGDLLAKLQEEYDLDLKTEGTKSSMDNSFFKKLRSVAMNSILRDIKHSARIPIMNSYLLVGVADEGPTYGGKEGYENVYCLREGEIFACLQTSPDSEPIWLEGAASLSRSPVAHQGDVQRVRAIGKPPEDRICLFRNLRNVVVMPSVGVRSLSSCLGGGDLDGDMFSVICHDPLLPTQLEEAANYEPGDTRRTEDDRDSTVDDICDFVVEYIHSDVLGLLSDRLLTIADQSNEGILDPDCQRLAQLCSQAVDYPKHGIPVSLDDENLPRPLIRLKPDWHAAEVVSPRRTDYYESSRALGHMFRAITLKDPEDGDDEPICTAPMSDPITIALFNKVQRYLGDAAFMQGLPDGISTLFKRYHDELHYICVTHTLTNTPGAILLEEEVVIGTILAKSSQKRWRKDRIYRMRLHVGSLVKDIKEALLADVRPEVYGDLINGLRIAWNAWNYSIYKRREFAANSFGLLALYMVFDCLEKISCIV